MRKVDRLQGKDIVLRRALLDDAAMIAAIINSPGVVEWWTEHAIEDIREGVAEFDEEFVIFMIEVPGAGPVGIIQYGQELDPQYFHASVDIAVHASWHRRGVASDAIRTLTRHLVDDLGHHRIVIDPAANNTAAIACYSSLGFRPVGVMRRYERGADGAFHDGLMMEVLADELT